MAPAKRLILSGLFGVALPCVMAIGCGTDQPAAPPADAGQAGITAPAAPPAPVKGKPAASNKFKSVGSKSGPD